MEISLKSTSKNDIFDVDEVNLDNKKLKSKSEFLG